MNTTIKRTIFGAVVALMLTGGLAGCASTTSANSLLSGLASSSSEATPEVTAPPEPIAGDLDGDGKLTAWESDQLARSTYTLVDGTVITLPSLDEPLPSVITDEITARIKAVAGRLDINGPAQREALAAAFQIIDEESARLGRVIVPIGYTQAKVGHAQWCVGDPAYAGCSDDKAAAMAMAVDWIKGQSKYVALFIS
jgi:hypothetical protein